MTMPETRHPLKVFLCHSSADKSKVREVYRYLKKRGIQPWLDAEELLPGQDWALEIPKALDDSDAIIIFLSKGSVNKEGYVQKEIKFALDRALEMPEGRIFIIPARLEPCDLPRSLSKYQWVNFYEEGGAERLLKALKIRGEQLQRVEVEPFSGEEVPLVLKHSEGQAETLVETPRHTSKHGKLDTAIVVALIGVVGTIVAALIGSPLWGTLFASPPNPTITAAAPLSQALPSQTSALGPISTETVSSAPAIPVVFNPQPDAADYFDALGVPMRLVSVGEFMMGANSPHRDAQIHKVSLRDYYIDKYEVTNVMYKACVAAGTCESPKQLGSKNRPSYYDNQKFANYPVIYVDWNMATAYCNWRGVRLPTEAEWEKAARGTTQSKYPWGDVLDHTYANYGQDIISGDTSEVGKYRKNKSPYGIYDLAGNVWEWVSDRYSDTYYATSPADNPSGPEDGLYRVVRGGSWANTEYSVLSAERYKLQTIPADADLIDLGFRCAMDVIP